MFLSFDNVFRSTLGRPALLRNSGDHGSCSALFINELLRPSSSLHILPSSAMTNVPDNFNYAAYFGYKSVAAAVILAIAYIPLAIYFPYAFFKNRSRTFITLSLFCLSESVVLACHGLGLS